MENSVTKVKKSRTARISKSAGIPKRISELEILRRAYEIYLETGVPYASEIEGLFEDGRDSGDYTELKSS
ncbi:MAG: hypothetical protein WA816_02485 [Bacteroidales bacterium]